MTTAPAPEIKSLSKKNHRGQFLLPMQLAKPKRLAAPTDGEVKELAAGEVAILARTREPVKIWGETIVHDFDSVKIPELTATDYCHDRNQIIGKADRWTVDKDGLKCVASLLSTAPGDRAEEILTRLDAGTPYQASIEFEGTLSYYPEGGVTVNGVKYDSAVWVWTDWSTEVIAICPRGRDGMTKAELLPQELCAKVDAAAPPIVTQHTGVGFSQDATVVTQEQIKKFHARFGPRASDYLAKELSYEQAVDAHAVEIEQQLAATKTELEEAKKLAAAKPKTGLMSRGQTEPISSGAPGSDKPTVKSLSPLEEAYKNPRFQVPKSSRN